LFHHEDKAFLYSIVLFGKEKPTIDKNVDRFYIIFIFFRKL